MNGGPGQRRSGGTSRIQTDAVAGAKPCSSPAGWRRWAPGSRLATFTGDSEPPFDWGSSGHAGLHLAAVVAPGRHHLRVAHGHAGDMPDGDRLLVVGEQLRRRSAHPAQGRVQAGDERSQRPVHVGIPTRQRVQATHAPRRAPWTANRVPVPRRRTAAGFDSRSSRLSPPTGMLRGQIPLDGTRPTGRSPRPTGRALNGRSLT